MNIELSPLGMSYLRFTLRCGRNAWVLGKRIRNCATLPNLASRLGWTLTKNLLHHLVDVQKEPDSQGRKDEPLYVCFINFEEAFNSVFRDHNFRCSKQRGVGARSGARSMVLPCWLWSLCSKISSFLSNVATSTVTLSAFKGVKQGVPHRPPLFSWDSPWNFAAFFALRQVSSSVMLLSLIWCMLMIVLWLQTHPRNYSDDFMPGFWHETEFQKNWNYGWTESFSEIIGCCSNTSAWR